MMLADCGPWAKTIIKSIETGEQFTKKFISYASEIARKENCDLSKPIPNEVWSYADKMFAWGNL